MPTQSLSGVVRERLQEIERKLVIGFSQQCILEELRAMGYQSTLKNLRNTLYRARKWAACNSSDRLGQNTLSGDISPVQLESSAGLLPGKNTGSSDQVVQVSAHCTNALKMVRGFEWTGNQKVNASANFFL